jgi:hypothetical protein
VLHLSYRLGIMVGQQPNAAAVLRKWTCDTVLHAFVRCAAAAAAGQAESYYDLPSWTDDEDELADVQQQPAGSTDGSVAAEASEAEGHDDGAADSSAAGGAAVTQLQSVDAAAATVPVSNGPSAPVLGIQQQPEQQQLQPPGIGKASEPGSLSSSDIAPDKQQHNQVDRQQQQQEDQRQPLQTVGEQQQQRQQQGVAKKLEACALAAVANSREANGGSGVADAVAVDADGQPTPVRPVKRLKADPAAAE